MLLFLNGIFIQVEILSCDGSQSEMRSIYKLYLMGADKCRILYIQTKELLDTALEIFELHPERGQRIEQLHLEIYKMDMLENAIKVSVFF
jgi:hypothetical protein